jgi:hypothetical protein
METFFIIIQFADSFLYYLLFLIFTQTMNIQGVEIINKIIFRRLRSQRAADRRKVLI